MDFRLAETFQPFGLLISAKYFVLFILVKCNKKTEMVKKYKNKSNQKKFEGDLKIKLCGKRLYPTQCVKYLGVKIDTNLSWQYHVNDLSIKLNRASNALLFKMRKYVNLKILRSIYFAIFDSCLS